MMIFLPVAFALAVMPVLSPALSESRATLASLRHDYRPLLVFAASDSDQVREQMRLLGERVKELQERQMVIVPILLHGGDERTAAAEAETIGLPERAVVRLEAGEDAAARRRFHVGQDNFTVILIGKDGGEKLRSQTPVTMERLMKVIDAMPMRQKEVRDGHYSG